MKAMAVKGLYVEPYGTEGWIPLGAPVHSIEESCVSKPKGEVELTMWFVDRLPKGRFHTIWWSLSDFTRPPFRQ